MQQRIVTAGQTLTYDVVVIGAGVAGLVAALDLLELAPALSVAIIDKGAPGSSGSTPLAQGGMAAAVGADDSPALHAADTIRAGDGLCDRYAVRTLTVEGPARVADLVRRGAVFDRRPDGSLDLAREGGQTVSRSVRTADATGAEIFRALRAQAVGRLTRLQGIVCDLARTSTGVVGAWALLDATQASPVGPAQEASMVLVRGRRVLLATGGCGGLYGSTTNRDGATADGVALAAAAGAELADLEFVQFHPTGLRPAGDVDDAEHAPRPDGSVDGCWRLLLTEALRGAGAVLLDADGRRFMIERHPDAELAPRHVVAKGILDQPGGAWLDATSIPPAALAREFPTVSRGVRRYGFDLSREPVPVEPVEHYMIGGVATDLHGRTSVPGLSAAGEVACTGVHGANRMAGNSLLQSCVFGHRAAVEIAATLAGEPDAASTRGPEVPALLPAADAPSGLADARRRLRAAMSAGAGAIRSAKSLESASAALEEAAEAAGPRPAANRESIELHHLIMVGRWITRSAVLRTESRGVHWREDHHAHDPAWEGVRIRVQGHPA